MGEALHIISWNVAGLCDPHKKLLVSNFVLSLRHPIHILMLHELKADVIRLELILTTILPHHQKIISFPNEGRGGTSLLLHLDFTILNSGVTSQGTVAWATLSSVWGKFSIASIYGPSLSSDHAHLWRYLENTLPVRLTRV